MAKTKQDRIDELKADIALAEADEKAARAKRQEFDQQARGHAKRITELRAQLLKVYEDGNK
jgi:hypothetical protein